jgi:hypothetical protein
MALPVGTQDTVRAGKSFENIMPQAEEIIKEESMPLMNMSSFDTAVNRKIIGKAYLQKDMKTYKKKLSFNVIRDQLSHLKLNLLDIDPKGDSSQYALIYGKSGRKYYYGMWESRSYQNDIKCRDLGGVSLLLHDLVDERINISRTVRTGDSFYLKDRVATCMLNGVELNGIACFRQLKNLAVMFGRNMQLSPMDSFQSALNDYADATLGVYINATHVYLAQNDLSYALCDVKSVSGREFRDSTAAVVQAKYFSHLSELYGQLIASMDSELTVLQNLAFYGVTDINSGVSQSLKVECNILDDVKLASVVLTS